MPFNVWGTLAPNEGQQIIGGDAAPYRTIIANSEVITIGDAVQWDANGFLVNDASVGAVAGIVVGVANSGVPVAPDSATTGTYTVASNNQTVAQIYAIIDISTDTLYSAPADAALGTTTGSNLPGYLMDLLASGSATQLDESTASATTGQFFSWGLDPRNTERVIVNLNERIGNASVT